MLTGQGPLQVQEPSVVVGVCLAAGVVTRAKQAQRAVQSLKKTVQAAPQQWQL